jgi:hypothetical protein
MMTNIVCFRAGPAGSCHAYRKAAINVETTVVGVSILRQEEGGVGNVVDVAEATDRDLCLYGGFIWHGYWMGDDTILYQKG